jgi:hypothetical protein
VPEVRKLGQRHQSESLPPVQSCFHGCQVEWSRFQTGTCRSRGTFNETGQHSRVGANQGGQPDGKTIGGFRRLHEMLGVVKEIGGVKKFKDLLEAMAVPEAHEIKLPF